VLGEVGEHRCHPSPEVSRDPDDNTSRSFRAPAIFKVFPHIPDREQARRTQGDDAIVIHPHAHGNHFVGFGAGIQINAAQNDQCARVEMLSARTRFLGQQGVANQGFQARLLTQPRLSRRMLAIKVNPQRSSGPTMVSHPSPIKQDGTALTIECERIE